MAGDTGKRVRMLFVDDEKPFLALLQQLASAWSKGAWEVFTAENAGQALSLLQTHPVDLIVVDVQMPVVDGVQFLGLLQRRFPALQKVVLTGYVNETYRAACLNGGAELYLEKPHTREGFEAVFSTLNELARCHADEGFRGVLRQVGLQDVIQMECLSRHSVVLEVSAGQVKGEIFICDGQVIHAVVEDKVGEAAFNAMLAFRGGEFLLRSYTDPKVRTIDGSYEFLLMEAVRLKDESAEHEALAATAKSATASRPAMEPGPAEPSGVADSAAAGEASALTSLMPAKGEAAAILAGLASLSTRAQGVARVEELLICSPQGDVLHQWQVANSDQRISLLEFVSKKARQIARNLPIGTLDRVELASPRGRAIVQIGPDRGVLVRTVVMRVEADAKLRMMG